MEQVTLCATACLSAATPAGNPIMKAWPIGTPAGNNRATPCSQSAWD